MTPVTDSSTGLARERTALARNRSGLAAAGCMAVLLRRLWGISGATQAVGIALVALSALVWGVATVTVTRAGRRDPDSAVLLQTYLVMTAATVVLAGVALFLSFVIPA